VVGPLQLKEELDLKTSELMLLEDEVMRLKRDLGSKEQEYLKASIKKEKECQAEVARLSEELQQLRTDLQERNAEIRHFKKAEAVLNREIKALKYDKLLL
jgi:peptidoglycan hydrolase CwlO-like protein